MDLDEVTPGDPGEGRKAMPEGYVHPDLKLTRDFATLLSKENQRLREALEGIKNHLKDSEPTLRDQIFVYHLAEKALRPEEKS